jgi:hypothetical protein
MPARPANHPQLAVTDDHRRAAFEAMHWPGWTFDQAMADDVRSRLVNLRARQICNAQARALRRHVVPALPLPKATAASYARVHLQPYQQAYLQAHLHDLKRAASGDRDED